MFVKCDIFKTGTYFHETSLKAYKTAHAKDISNKGVWLLISEPSK